MKYCWWKDPSPHGGQVAGGDSCALRGMSGESIRNLRKVISRTCRLDASFLMHRACKQQPCNPAPHGPPGKPHGVASSGICETAGTPAASSPASCARAEPPDASAPRWADVILGQAGGLMRFQTLSAMPDRPDKQQHLVLRCWPAGGWPHGRAASSALLTRRVPPT